MLLMFLFSVKRTSSFSFSDNNPQSEFISMIELIADSIEKPNNYSGVNEHFGLKHCRQFKAFCITCVVRQPIFPYPCPQCNNVLATTLQIFFMTAWHVRICQRSDTQE